LRRHDRPRWKDTRRVNRVLNANAVTACQVRIGKPDPSLTPSSGLVAVTELIDRLGVTTVLDTHVGPVKQRKRGLTGGELLVAMASCQLAGGDHLVSLDRMRADTAGQQLVAVATPASTTAAGVARRFTPGICRESRWRWPW
jgi:hypothetical protein